ncbi:hypothetical protein JCM18899A_35290 [Nocardioides sp. AN3]
MSHGDQPIVLTDEDGVALGIVCEGELHPVAPRHEHDIDGTAPAVWAVMSDLELLTAMQETRRTLSECADRAVAGDDVGTDLVDYDKQLTGIEDELIRRAFSQSGFPRNLRRRRPPGR